MDMTFLIVTGAKRSGTTALASSLNTHSEVGILQEYGPQRLFDDIGIFFRRWREQFGTDGIPEGIGADFDPASFPLPRADRDFDRLLAGVYGALFPGKTLRVIGDKAPLFLNTPGFDRLVDAVPDTRLLYVLRNPVDVALSSMARAQLAGRQVDVWGTSTAHQACREWLDDVRRAGEIQQSGRCPALVVKYEDLVGPRAGTVWDRIAGYLHLPNRFRPAFRQNGGRGRQRPADDAQYRYIRNCFDVLDDAWADEGGETLVSRARALALPLAPGQVISFEAGLEGNSYLGTTFEAPEPGGCWTIGPRAEVAFRATDLSTETMLEIDFSSRVSTRNRVLNLAISVNGHRRRFTMSPTAWDEVFRVEVRLTPAIAGSQGQVRIVFEIGEPKTPDEEPRNDPRAIGIFLRRMRLVPASILGSSNLSMPRSHDVAGG